MEVKKNSKYTLHDKIPASIRLKVYKEAKDTIIRFIDNIDNHKYREYNLISPSLCLLLPCILWGLSKYLDDDPNGEPWSFYDTKTAFPEIADGIKDITHYANSHYYKRHLIGITKYNINLNNIRLEVINNIIKDKSWQTN